MRASQSHPVVIVGLGFGNRAQYVEDHVRIGDPLSFSLESDNPYDRLTVAAHHHGRHIGYVAPGWRWIAHSLEAGEHHEAVVTAFEAGPRNELTGIVAEITVSHDETPLPGTAPWAPKVIYEPRPRWPVVIPLALLAAIAGGFWLIADETILSGIAQLAAAL